MTSVFSARRLEIEREGLPGAPELDAHVAQQCQLAGGLQREAHAQLGGVGEHRGAALVHQRATGLELPFHQRVDRRPGPRDQGSARREVEVGRHLRDGGLTVVHVHGLLGEVPLPEGQLVRELGNGAQMEAQGQVAAGQLDIREVGAVGDAEVGEADPRGRLLFGEIDALLQFDGGAGDVDPMPKLRRSLALRPNVSWK